MSEPFKIGLLGHGTVGGAFEQLLNERAATIERVTGFRPETAGVLTSHARRLREIVEGCDLIVELIGGVEPARDYVLEAMTRRQARRTANKQLLSQHGEELWRSRASTGSSCVSRARSAASYR